MRMLHQFVTFLFWLSVIFYGLNFLQTAGRIWKHLAESGLLDTTSALGIRAAFAALVPGLLWIFKQNLKSRVKPVGVSG